MLQGVFVNVANAAVLLLLCLPAACFSLRVNVNIVHNHAALSTPFQNVLSGGYYESTSTSSTP